MNPFLSDLCECKFLSYRKSLYTHDRRRVAHALNRGKLHWSLNIIRHSQSSSYSQCSFPLCEVCATLRWSCVWRDFRSNKTFALAPIAIEGIHFVAVVLRIRIRRNGSILCFQFFVAFTFVIRIQCIGCQLPLTLKHILLNCVDFLALRQQFYSACNMHYLFSKVKPEEMLAILRIAGLYYLI